MPRDNRIERHASDPSRGLGAQGLPGVAGAKGNTGPQGLKGDKGDAGPPSATGASGVVPRGTLTCNAGGGGNQCAGYDDYLAPYTLCVRQGGPRMRAGRVPARPCSRRTESRLFIIVRSWRAQETVLTRALRRPPCGAARPTRDLPVLRVPSTGIPRAVSHPHRESSIERESTREPCAAPAISARLINDTG